MSRDTSQLAEHVRRKRDCLAQLHELGVQQCCVADGGDVNDLLRILGAKQQLINQLQAIERDLDPYRGEDPERREWRAPADRLECARTLEQCDLLYQRILEQERGAEQTLRRRRDESLDRLRDAYAAGEARQAYAHELTRAGESLDLTSEM